MKKYISSKSIAARVDMLHRNGDIYPSIGGVVHPNPDMVEATVSWILEHNIPVLISHAINWIESRLIEEGEHTEKISDIIDNIVADQPHTGDLRKYLVENAPEYSYERHDEEIDTDKVESDMFDAINSRFLRVRAGGMYDNNAENAIYFRISSKGYDWNRGIVDYLWDVYEYPDFMPKRIWVGHDAETNPPELTLFDGSAYDLMEKMDDKLYASWTDGRIKIESCLNSNSDRKSISLNTMYNKMFPDHIKLM